MTTLNNEKAKHKMIFLSLLSGAMAYRNKYIEHELAENKVLCEEMGNSALSDKGKVNTPGKIRRVQQKAAHMHYEFKKKVERFNSIYTQEIEMSWQEFKKPTDNSFQEYIDNFGAILEQVINSANIPELLSVCQAYNAGLLDEAVKVIIAAQAQEKEGFFEKVENIEKNNVGESIDIASEPVKLTVVKDDDKPYSDA
jgi:hypothetical protein